MCNMNNHQLKHDLNNTADALTTTYHSNPHPQFLPPPKPIFHCFQAVAVHMKNTTITSKLYTTICSNIYAPQLQQTICRSSSLNPKYFNKTDWDNHASAFKSLSRQQKITISKHVHNLWHTSAKDHLYHPDQSTACHNYNHPSDAGSLCPLKCLITQAYHEQSKIGWHHFLHGQLSLSWHPVFLFIYKSGITCYTPPQITKALIISIWQYSLDIWYFRNGKLLGHNFEEQCQHQLTDLCAATRMRQREANPQEQQLTFHYNHDTTPSSTMLNSDMSSFKLNTVFKISGVEECVI